MYAHAGNLDFNAGLENVQTGIKKIATLRNPPKKPESAITV